MPYPTHNRKPAELTVQIHGHSVWTQFGAGDSGDYVATEFRHIGGIEAVRNRKVWVRTLPADLAKMLAAIPKDRIPEHMRLSVGEVIEWLGGAKPLLSG